MPDKDKKKKVVYHQGTDTLLKDIKELIKLPLKRAMETASRISPGGTPREALRDYTHTGMLPVNIWRDIGYINTGVGSPSFKEYNGLFGTHSTENIRPDIVDATVYGVNVNPIIAKQVEHEPGDYGLETNYVNKHFPGQNIQYIETEPHGINIPSQEGIKSLGAANETFGKGEFRISLPNTGLNTAGFVPELGERNDSLFIRGWDVYDFLTPENDESGYKNTHAAGLNRIENKLVDIYSKNTHPIVIRTPWVHHSQAGETLWNHPVDLNINELLKNHPELNLRKNGGLLDRLNALGRDNALQLIRSIRQKHS